MCVNIQVCEHKNPVVIKFLIFIPPMTVSLDIVWFWFCTFWVLFSLLCILPLVSLMQLSSGWIQLRFISQSLEEPSVQEKHCSESPARTRQSSSVWSSHWVIVFKLLSYQNMWLYLACPLYIIIMIITYVIVIVMMVHKQVGHFKLILIT